MTIFSYASHVTHELDASRSSQTITAIPRNEDVLCGRGKTCFFHGGNDHFRMLIAQNVELYKAAPTKKVKMQVVALVVDTVITKGGRFLTQDKDGNWIDGGRKQGKKKTGHAMRDALRGRVKCIAQMREKNSLMSRALCDDSSHSSSSINSIEEFDYDWINEMESRDRSSFEPSLNWRHTKIDKDIASTLLSFFIAEEFGDQNQYR